MAIGLSNLYVNQLCKQLLDNTYHGTYSCDEIKAVADKLLREQISFSIIVNISPKSCSEGHFIALCFKSGEKTLIIFDSLRFSFKDPNVEKFVQKLNSSVSQLKIVNINRQIQSFQSSFCGFHTIGFLLSQDDRVQESLSDYMKRFHHLSLSKNDKVVMKYIINFIRKFGINE